MSKNLVIVESPAKAKTIEKYLGKDFTVKSSFGHVRDLPKGNNSIDIAHGFQPLYEITEDKRHLVDELKKLARTSDMVWLATDDDREGEAISWHLKEALELKDSTLKRIVFREITETAIKKAIQNPRGIDYDLVNAQQARRVLDRLVGFELSPLLWKKIKTGLSAGRVQSVAVRLIVEREREIERFNSKSAFKVTAKFQLEKDKFLLAELPERFNTEAEALAFLTACIPAEYKVINLETKPFKRNPAAPFTTSTLQQEASLKLGYSVAQTMLLAQKLYEAGHISYMRTDSVNLSEQALNAAKEQITKEYGPKYSKRRVFKTKNESAQEAHEAIRPTDFAAQKAGADRDEQRLYELIWKRTIASQMAEAELERTTATISISTVPQVLVATGEVIKFDGFLKVYTESSHDENEEENTAMLPPILVGQILDLQNMNAVERFSRPAARYTEASLVKKLEEMGIGRPSTYAPTISTIIKREYVIKETREGKNRNYQQLTLQNGKITTTTKAEIFGAEKAKLFPTDMGVVVTDFLLLHFPNVVDYSFTAQVEKEFDEIAHGGKIWNEMIDNFYKGFHASVETTNTIDRSSVPTSRDLGVHPESGKKMLVRLGRFGPLVQIGETESEEKPLFASLKKNQRMETITLDEALDLFKLPRETGIFEGKTMTVGIGRFGPFVRHDNKFISLAKTDDPYTITEERCIELIEGKRKADIEKVIRTFDSHPEVRILKGQWGPYIAAEGKNVKIPKDADPSLLSLDEVLTLIADAPEAKGRFGKAKASPAKTVIGPSSQVKTKATGTKATTSKAANSKTTGVEAVKEAPKKRSPAKGSASGKTSAKTK